MAKRYESEYNRLRNNLNRRIERARKKGYATIEKLPTYRQAKASGTLAKSRSVIRKASKKPIGYAGVMPSKKEAKERDLIKTEENGKIVYKEKESVIYAGHFPSDTIYRVKAELREEYNTYRGMAENFKSWFNEQIEKATSVTAIKKKNEPLVERVIDISEEFKTEFEKKIKEAEQIGYEKGVEEFYEYYEYGYNDVYNLGVDMSEQRSVVSLFEKLQEIVGDSLYNYLYHTAKTGSNIAPLFATLNPDADTFSDVFQGLDNYVEDEF